MEAPHTSQKRAVWRIGSVPQIRQAESVGAACRRPCACYRGVCVIPGLDHLRHLSRLRRLASVRLSSLRGASIEVLRGDLRNFFREMCSITDCLPLGPQGFDFARTAVLQGVIVLTRFPRREI